MNNIDDNAPEDTFVAAMTDSDWLVRMKAVRFLGRTGNRKHMQTILNALSDSSIYVCEAAVSALAQVGDKTVIAPLVAIARTGHPAAVEKMLKSIKSWEPIEQRRATEKIVAAANTDLRVSAIRALASLRDQGIFDPTAFLSGGPNPSGEKVVSDALSKLK